MDPRNSEILAMANWPPVDPYDLADAETARPAQPRDRLHLRAGLDLQGLHRRRGARGRNWSTPHSAFTLAPTIQVADRVIEESHAGGTETLTVAQILAQSSNVGAVTIGLELGSERFSQLDRPLRLRPPDRGPVPGRGARDRARARGILGLDDGQPAARPGPLGDADADDGRLRGDRQRRHPARSRADRAGRRRAGAGAAGASG